MSVETKIFDVIQDSSGSYTAQLVNEAGNGVSSALISSATITLYDDETEVSINSRYLQNILNTNQVTIDTSGNLEWLWLPADMPRSHTDRRPELHTALFIIAWSAGTKQIKHEVHFRVHKVKVIPAP